MYIAQDLKQTHFPERSALDLLLRMVNVVIAVDSSGDYALETSMMHITKLIHERIRDIL